MNEARCCGSVAVVNRYIHVAGGLNTENALMNAVECYNPISDEWVRRAPMNKPRNYSTLFRSNEFLYSIGGDSAIERYDPWKICWKEVSAWRSIRNSKIQANSFETRFQVGSFNGSSSISNAIEINGGIFVIMKNGIFGQIKFDENDGISFVVLNKLENESEYLGQHYLHENLM